MSVSPYLVDFQRVLKSSPEEADVVPGVSNRELFHAAVALYDVSLPEITPEILYSTVTEKWARTILLVRDADETAEEYKVRFDKGKLGRRTMRTQTTKGRNSAKSAPQSEESAALKEQGCGSSSYVTHGEHLTPKATSSLTLPAVQPCASARRTKSVSKDAWTETEPHVTADQICNGEDGSKSVPSADEKWDTLWPDSGDDDNDNSSKFGAVFSDSSSSSGSDQVQ